MRTTNPAGSDSRHPALDALLGAVPWLEERIARELTRRADVGPHLGADDLQQEILLSAYRQLVVRPATGAARPDWWQPRARLEAYLGAAVRRSVLRALRDGSCSRRLSVGDFHGDTIAELADQRSDPARSAERRQIVSRYLRWIAELPTTSREALLSQARGESVEAFALQLGLSVAAVAKRRQRALALLRARCAGGDCEGPPGPRTTGLRARAG